MVFVFIVFSSMWIPFRSAFDTREFNIDYLLLERARIEGKADFITSIKPISTDDIAPLSIYSHDEPNMFLRFRFRDWGFLTHDDEVDRESKYNYENYLQLYGEAYWRYGKIELYHSTALFNEQRYHSVEFRFYDPLINTDFKLYTFDAQPPIGHVNLFDVRTDMSFLHYNGSFVDFAVGRLPVRLGPGFRSSLFLSGYSLPLNYVYNFRFHNRYAVFMAAYGLFPDTIKMKRFAYQRLVIKYRDVVEIGFNQGVIWAQSDPFKYINPIDLYYIVQRRGESNSDNLIGGMDISLFLKGKAKVYAEFLDDDFIVTSDLPSKYGVMVGAHVLDPLNIPLSDLIVEFTHINPWTYPHFYSDYESNPEVLGYPIGFWGGPGCNDFTADFFKFTDIRPNSVSGFRVGYEFLQHTQLDMRTGAGVSQPFEPDYHFDIRNSIHFYVFRRSEKFSFEGGIEATFMSGEYFKGNRVAVRFNISYLPITMDLDKLL